MAILISGKVDFRTKKITRGRGTLQNDKNVNPLRRRNFPKFVFIKQKSYKICEAKADKTERRSRQICDYCWRLFKYHSLDRGSGNI